MNTSKRIHLAKLASASGKSFYRHSVYGKTSAVSFLTLRCVVAILYNCKSVCKKKLHAFSRPVTKSFIQSDKRKRLIIYHPPEIFKFFLQFMDNSWQALLQIYGDIEVVLYCHNTLVPWLLNNFNNLQQLFFDPSFLYDRGRSMPESLLQQKASIAGLFGCRELEPIQTDFKGIDVKFIEERFILSQKRTLITTYTTVLLPILR